MKKRSKVKSILHVDNPTSKNHFFFLLIMTFNHFIVFFLCSNAYRHCDVTKKCHSCSPAFKKWKWMIYLVNKQWTAWHFLKVSTVFFYHSFLTFIEFKVIFITCIVLQVFFITFPSCVMLVSPQKGEQCMLLKNVNLMGPIHIFDILA